MKNLTIVLAGMGCIFLTSCNSGSNTGTSNQVEGVSQGQIKLEYRGNYKFGDTDIEAFSNIAMSPNNELYAISYFNDKKSARSFFINMFSIKDYGLLALEDDYMLPRKDWTDTINGLAFGNDSDKYLYMVSGNEVSSWVKSTDSRLYSIQETIKNQDTQGGVVVHGNYAYSVTYGDYINWYNVKNDGTLIYQGHLKNGDAQLDVAFSAKSKYIYSVTDGGGAGGLFQYGYINWYSINNDGSLTYRGHLKNDDVPTNITISSDGKYAYVVTQNRGWSGPRGYMEWYAINDDGSLTRQGYLKLTDSLPSGLAVSLDNKYLYAARGYALDYYEILQNN